MAIATHEAMPTLLAPTDWIARVKAETGLKTIAKFVCLLLADCWDEVRNPEAPISILAEEIQGQAGLSRSSFYRALRDSSDLGYLAQVNPPRQHRLPEWRPIVPEQAEAVRAILRDRRQKAPGVIYYLHIGDYVKVGYTSDLGNRLNSYPPDTRVLHSHPGTLDDEADMHAKLRPHLAARREWYVASPELLTAIEAMKSV